MNYRLKYISNEPVNEHAALRKVCERNGISVGKVEHREYRWHGTSFFNKSINLLQCFDAMIHCGAIPEKPTGEEIHLEPAVVSWASEMREWIKKCRIEEKIEAAKRKERERREYAAPLPEWCKVPSSFAGVRELHLMPVNRSRLDELSDLLISLYREHGEKITQGNVYCRLQGLEGKGTVQGFTDSFMRLKKYAEERGV